MDWKRPPICLMLCASIVLVIGPASAQTKKPLVRLNYSGSIYATTSVIAVEKGFFDDEGLIVNATPESSGQIALQALPTSPSAPMSVRYRPSRRACR